ncbi:MAG: hypothetical protein IIC73_08810, partial [Armatimonadetes bacterium]|nr:hypothetical protein [Armatimonadota bacterium]
MQKRERIRHLLRRFGMGASPREVRALEHLELTEAVDRLIDYEQIPDPYPVSPWE